MIPGIFNEFHSDQLATATWRELLDEAYKVLDEQPSGHHDRVPFTQRPLPVEIQRDMPSRDRFITDKGPTENFKHGMNDRVRKIKLNQPKVSQEWLVS